MTATFRRWMRQIAPLLLVLGLTLAPAVSQSARAQPPDPSQAEPEVEGKGSGRPLDGYFGTCVLLLLALFIVGKSARR